MRKIKVFRRWILWIYVPLFIIDWLFFLFFINSIFILANRSGYKPSNFIVNRVYEIETYGKGQIKTKCIEGSINNARELYIPFASIDHPYYNSIESGDVINVLYNPDMTDVIVQGMTLRVIPADVNLFKDLLFPLTYLIVIIIPSGIFFMSLYRRGPILFSNKL